jgi:hypothetical protein
MPAAHSDADRFGLPAVLSRLIRRGLRLHGDAVGNAEESVRRDRYARYAREQAGVADLPDIARLHVALVEPPEPAP